MKEETKESVLELRWFVLFLMGLTVFGCFYAYDSPVPIANFIIRDLGITKAQYGLLFSAYSLPNLIVVFLGGILVDKIGIRKAGILFASICFAGILITAASPTFLLMVCGRIIYGIGTDSFLVTNLKILSKWFKGKELSFALHNYRPPWKCRFPQLGSSARGLERLLALGSLGFSGCNAFCAYFILDLFKSG